LLLAQAVLMDAPPVAARAFKDVFDCWNEVDLCGYTSIHKSISLMCARATQKSRTRVRLHMFLKVRVPCV
jgi:hypothetical protein